MSTEETPDAVERERELREREQEAEERDRHERGPTAGTGDPLDEESDERKPAPPGPEAQQPRG